MQYPHWPGVAALSVISIGWAIFFLFFYDSHIQQEHELLEVRGQVRWVSKNKYGLHFKLQGQPQQFSYSDVSGDVSKVKKALQTEGNEMIILQYEKRTHGPMYSDERYHAVWSIRTEQEQIRSYQQVLAKQLKNDNMMPFIGLGFLLGGLYLGYIVIKSFRAASKNREFDHLFPWH